MWKKKAFQMGTNEIASTGAWLKYEISIIKNNLWVERSGIL